MRRAPDVRLRMMYSMNKMRDHGTNGNNGKGGKGFRSPLYFPCVPFIPSFPYSLFTLSRSLGLIPLALLLDQTIMSREDSMNTQLSFSESHKFADLSSIESLTVMN